MTNPDTGISPHAGVGQFALKLDIAPGLPWGRLPPAAGTAVASNRSDFNWTTLYDSVTATIETNLITGESGIATVF